MTYREKIRLVVLTGPTGVGKTELSLTLAEQFGAEILNADSMQVYRFLDIGTAKPTPAQRQRAPHHLFDLADPDQDFDAAAYLGLARPLIEDLNRRGKRALVVGGTGLYLRSLLKGLFVGPGRDPEFRRRLGMEAMRLGWPALHERLAAIDPEAARVIHPRDRVRIERALEVHALTGRPISQIQAEHGLRERPFDVLFYCLNLDRPRLLARIEDRTRDMYDSGLVEETREILGLGYGPDLKPLQSIGYLQAVAVIQGRLSPKHAVEQTIVQTRRLAKRQITWFKAQPEARWRSPGDAAEILKEVRAFWSGRP